MSGSVGAKRCAFTEKFEIKEQTEEAPYRPIEIPLGVAFARYADWEDLGIVGESRRYYAGLRAFLDRDPENFGEEDPRVTEGGCFSRRKIAFCPELGELTVSSKSGDEETIFEIPSIHLDALFEKVMQTKEWQRLMQLTEEDLALLGLARESQSWGGYECTWFDPIEHSSTSEPKKIIIYDYYLQKLQENINK